MLDAIRVGTSGWSFPDWVGPFYPEGMKDRDLLPFYAARFRALEWNATHYRPPSPEACAALAAKTPAGFAIVVKAYRGITHEPEDPDPLPTFRDALAPLAAAGKLGGVLLQYPQRLHATAEARRRVAGTARALGDVPVVAEFRHRTWATPESLRFLRDSGIGFCCVDEPDLPDLMPRIAEATGRVGYLRFHSRDASAWYGEGERDRYDYLYSDAEMSEWLTALRDLAATTVRTFVFFNNCHRGQAAQNARAFARILAREGLAPPQPQPPEPPKQTSLF